MAAAAIPLLMGGATSAGGAIKNDIAIVKWTTAPKKKKGKKAKPPKDIELHVNGASIGMGLAALGAAGLIGAAALWASGMGLRVEAGKEKIIKARTIVSGNPSSPTVRTIVYTGNNRPLRTINGGISSEEQLLSKKEIMEGWKVVRKSRTIVQNTASGETIFYGCVVRNDNKRSVRMVTRPRFTIGGSKDNTDPGLFGAVTGAYGDDSAHYLS